MRISSRNFCLALAAAFLAFGNPAAAEGRPVKLNPPPDSVPNELRQQLLAAIKLYTNKDHAVRIKALDDFVKVSDPASGRMLFSIALGDTCPEVRIAAMELLRTAADKQWVTVAVNLACGVLPDDLRDRAAKLLKDSAAEAVPMLIKILNEGTPRLHAATDKIAIDFDSNDYSVMVGRLAAARALRFIGGDDAVAALRRTLGDKEWEMRAAAAHSLGELGDGGSVALLIKSSTDDDKDVAIESFIALGRIGGPQAKARLAKAAKDRDDLLAGFAERALKVLNAKKGEANPPYQPEGGAKDVLFVIDATFSMQMTYDGLKAWLKDKLKKEWTREDQRYGFIEYRDHNNAWYTQEHYFSWDRKKVDRYIDKLHATGAERGEGGGMDRALGVAMLMNWRDIGADRELDAQREIRLIGDVSAYDDALAEMRARNLFEHARVPVNAMCLNNSSDIRAAFARVAKSGGGSYEWFAKNTMSKWGTANKPPAKPTIGGK